MTDWGIDQWVNVVMSMLATVACFTCAAVYHWRTNWWHSQIGRNQMFFAVTIGLLFLYTVLATFLQDSACALMVLRSIRTAIGGAVVALMMQRARLIVKAQRESRDRTGV
jgi:multidrug efflux pump subunit AcrB